jgi:hypothetical protein
MKAIDNSNHNNGFYESVVAVDANFWNCLNEQRCIVARVDQLMSLCDELEARLARSQADSERLMEAVVGRMLAE